MRSLVRKVSRGYARTMVYKNEAGYDIGDISRDKRWLAFDKPVTTSDSEVYLYDRQTQQMQHLTPHQGEILHEVQSFSPDGKSLYMTTTEGGEFKSLVRVDLATKTRTTVEKPEWDVQTAAFSRSGKYLVVINKGRSGTINGGGPEFQFQTLNGNIRLRKGK